MLLYEWFNAGTTQADKCRNIKQYHYITWPDFGVPDKIDEIITFVTQVRDNSRPYDDGPILVHCR